MEKHEDGMKERRWVKLAGGEYNANQLPPEWDQWLRKSRLQAPTDSDMAKCALILRRHYAHVLLALAPDHTP